MTHIYPAVFEPNDDGTYTVWFPDMPSCITEGKSLENALNMARAALCTWLDNLKSKEESPPSASAANAIKIQGDQFVSLVEANMDVYYRRMNSTAVRRTISLPKYLDEMANDAHISLSAIAQDALRAHFNISD